ncbi:Trm112p-domain-containing protein [Choiromyces venosus 120613-1]|uniref:Multifunctional methyltransferase subunit trm112 n=1 Tax=Choiromyces venosus 120613-1 TaxID=1336337 RepID=A0A3N4JC46_9PEZI|nr:Trm112p-domain-containing protein [Choiromyces venosus 120613-1]
MTAKPPFIPPPHFTLHPTNLPLPPTTPPPKMKILTTNYLTCALRACKSHPSSFPLHFRDAELQQDSLPFNAAFIANILPRIDWPALLTTATELGFTGLPAEKPDLLATAEMEADEGVGRELHRILLETQVVEGKLVCGNCGHEYAIHQGIANFLLPGHLV